MFFVKFSNDEDPISIMILINNHITKNGFITIRDILSMAKTTKPGPTVSKLLDHGYTKPFEESDVTIRDVYSYDILKREYLIGFPDPEPLEGENHGKVL